MRILPNILQSNRTVKNLQSNKTNLNIQSVCKTTTSRYTHYRQNSNRKEKPKQIQEVGLGHSLEIKSNEGSEIEADDL